MFKIWLRRQNKKVIGNKLILSSIFISRPMVPKYVSLTIEFRT